MPPPAVSHSGFISTHDITVYGENVEVLGYAQILSHSTDESEVSVKVFKKKCFLGVSSYQTISIIENKGLPFAHKRFEMTHDTDGFSTNLRELTNNLPNLILTSHGCDLRTK